MRNVSTALPLASPESAGHLRRSSAKRSPNDRIGQRTGGSRRLILIGLVFALCSVLLFHWWARVAADVDLNPAEAVVVAPVDGVSRQDQPTQHQLPPHLPPLHDSSQPETASDMIAEADAVVKHLVWLLPKRPDAYEVGARFLIWNGDVSTAASFWQRALELDPAYVHAYVGLGSAAAERGDHAQAAEFYQTALKNEPEFLSASIGMAKALLALRRGDEAEKLLEQTAKTFPEDADVWYQLGVARQQVGEFEASITAFKCALAAQPRYAAAHIGLATAYGRLRLAEGAQRHRDRYKQLREAELEHARSENREFNDDLATRREIARIYLDAGRVYLAAGRYDAGELVWNRCIDLDPSSVDCLQALAWLYLQQDRPELTITMLNRIATLEPLNIGYPIEIARLLTQLGRIEEAESVLLQSREKVPPGSPPAADLAASLAGLYLTMKSRSEEAILLARESVQTAPAAERFALLSAAYERNRRWQEAADAMAEALRSAPESDRYRREQKRLQQLAERNSARSEVP